MLLFWVINLDLPDYLPFCLIRDPEVFYSLVPDEMWLNSHMQKQWFDFLGFVSASLLPFLWNCPNQPLWTDYSEKSQRRPHPWEREREKRHRKEEFPQQGRRKEDSLLGAAVSRSCPLSLSQWQAGWGHQPPQLPQDHGCQSGIPFPCLVENSQPPGSVQILLTVLLGMSVDWIPIDSA